MRKLVALATVAMLAACAAPSQPYLDAARVGCAKGYADACGMVPVFQSQVTSEQNQQAAAIALGVLGVAAIAADAYVGSQCCYYVPTYHYRHW